MGILDYIERIKRENEGPRITAQEPRIGLKPGGIVEPGVVNYGKTMPGRISKLEDGRWVWYRSPGRGYETIYAKNKTELLKKIKKIKAKSKSLDVLSGTAGQRNIIRSNTNKWTTNWLDNNLNNFELRESDKYLDKLKKDFAVEVKTNPKKYTFQKFKIDVNVIGKTGFPQISPGRKFEVVPGGKKGQRRMVTNPNAFNYMDVGTMRFGGGEELPISQKAYFKKIFFHNYLNKNSKFKQKVTNYMQYIIKDKSRLVNQYNLKEFRRIGELMADKDVIYLLSQDAGMGPITRASLFNKNFPELYKPFQNKVDSSSVTYKKNLALIEKKLGKKRLKKLLGADSIQASMRKEHKALAKIFDVSELPDSIKYSVDHQYGIAQAAASKDKLLMEKTLTNLRGMTKAMNTGLGWGGYNSQLKYFTNEINAGKNVAKNLKDLNKLTEVAYNVKGAYQLSPENKVISAAHFVGESQPERFASYFQEIAKTTEGTAAIKKQYGSLDNLLKTLKTAKGPAKVKAVASIVAIGGGYLADKLLKEHGISLTQDENEQVLEASMLPGDLIKEHPVTSAAVAGTTLRASKRVKGDPLKWARKVVHTPVTFPLKKLIRAAGTPLAGVGFAGWRIHDELKAGKSLTDAVIDPIVGAELAFPSLFKENISKIIPQKYQNVVARTGRKLLGLGKVGSRFMGPVGVAIGATGSVYDAYKDYQRRKPYIEKVKELRRQGLIKEEEFDETMPMFAGGGIASLTRTVAPDSGPMSQGLRSLYIDDMDY